MTFQDIEVTRRHATNEYISIHITHIIFKANNVTIINSVGVKQCPHCKSLLGIFNQLSGNTFGGQHWTDGKSLFPMLIQYESLVKPNCCKKLVWLDRLDLIDTIVLWPREKSEAETKKDIFEKLQSYSEPEFSDYMHLLTTSSYELNEEKHYRTLAWWAGNNIRRKYFGKTRAKSIYSNEMSEDEIINIKILFSLLSENIQNEVIAKAEIKRNLGEFDTAKELLGKVTEQDLRIYADGILDLCLKDDCFLQELII